MARTWYVDEGLAKLIDEWKKENPGATVYTIADENHSQDPDKSQHAPDDGGPKPGDDKGEVDGGDFMPGKGVTEKELDDLAEGLRKSEDKRLLIVIRRQRIFSSYPVAGYEAFTWRPYSGNYHGHTHVSMNDNYDNNQSDWKWEKIVARKEIPTVEVEGIKIPQLQFGDDDAIDAGYNHVARVQVLANWLDNKTPDLDVDGNYGAKTTAKFKALFGTDGRKLSTEQYRRLHGL